MNMESCLSILRDILVKKEKILIVGDYDCDGVTATAEALGKPVGSDADNDKVTYVSLLGLEQARALAAQRTAAAVAALDAFGAGADSLRQLANALLTRDH